jgi:type II secretory ATPase GspE/PulE/Tfp pilus assembly ATPase PilB-like protein
MPRPRPTSSRRLPSAPVADQRLLAFLRQTGRIDPATAANVESTVADGRLSAIDALVESGTLSDRDLARLIAEALKLPLVDLGSVPPTENGAGVISRSTAEHYGLVPVRITENALVVAMANPFDHEALQYIETASGMRLEPVVAVGSQVLAAIERLYKHEASLGLLLADVASSGELGAASELSTSGGLAPSDVRAVVTESEPPPIAKLLNLILFEALKAHASDVHIEPGPNLVVVRFRIEGILEEHMQMPRWIHGAIAARMKAMAKLDLAQRLLPQEGHFAVRVRAASLAS